MSSKKAKRLQQKQQPQGWFKPFVATPAYDGKFDLDYVISIAETCMVAPKFNVLPQLTTMRNGAFIDVARNRFVEMFLKTDCTHLFFIDADLRWEPRAFVGLVRAGLPVCAGVYPKRQTPEEYPVRCVPDPDNGGVWVKDGWVMADRVPTGFLCIRRDIVEEMAKDAPIIRCKGEPDLPRLFYTYVNENDAYVGEDFAWSMDYCKRYKTPVYVWPDFDFTHGGQWKGNWHDFLLKAGEEGTDAANAAPEDEALDFRESVAVTALESLNG